MLYLANYRFVFQERGRSVYFRSISIHYITVAPLMLRGDDRYRLHGGEV
ncbi:MAG: hypothetical protein ACLRSW_06020 [Christensenellaceae bacterium]